MPSRNLLMVCFYFPPCGGVAVQRSLKFARYMVDYGWKPIILTEDERALAHLPQDPGLLTELHPDTEIVRTSSRRRQAAFRWIHRLRVNRVADFLTPVDMHFWWAVAAYRRARRLIRHKEISALYTTSGPPSAHIVGLWLSRSECIPWVADFRDPWTQWHSYRARTFIHEWLDTRLERQVLERAGTVIANTHGSRELLLAKHGEQFASKVVVIPNGYDEEDFADVAVSVGRADKLRLVYVGTVYGDYGIPSDREFPRGFFSALRRLKCEQGELARLIETVFVGRFSECNQKVLDDLDIRDMVKVIGHVSHTRAVQCAVEAGANLLLMSGWPGNMVQAKLYELIRAGRPIMAVVPQGDADDLLSGLGNPYRADPDDPDEIYSQLLRLISDWQSGALDDFAFDPTDISAYSRRHLTGRLVDHVEQLLHVKADDLPRAY